MHTRSAEDHAKYAQQRNRTTKAIRDARHAYESNLVRNLKLDPRKLYRYIRSQQRVKARVSPLMTSSGKLTSNDSEVAEELNTFFKSMFVLEDVSNVPDFTRVTDNMPVLQDIDINVMDVKKELDMLKMDKSQGPDGIPTNVLKCCSDALAWPLTILFKKSLSAGEIPEDWKRASVIPLFKKGKKSSPSNYRPISFDEPNWKIYGEDNKERHHATYRGIGMSISTPTWVCTQEILPDQSA